MKMGPRIRALAVPRMGWGAGVVGVWLICASSASAFLPWRGYKVEFAGVGDSELLATLRAVSETVALRRSPPDTIELFELRAQRDIRDRLRLVLFDSGYYDAEIEADIRGAGRDAVVTFTVTLNDPYMLESVRFEFPAGFDVEQSFPFAAETLGLEVGKRSEAVAIVKAGEQAVRRLRERGYPFARLQDRRVVADAREKAIRVTYRLDPGPRADFGAVRISGLRKVSRRFVLTKLDWKEGEPYSVQRVEATRQRLSRTGLFTLLSVQPAEESSVSNGVVDMSIQITERRRRTVSLSGGYSTDKGWQTRDSWEYRNLFGYAERLKVQGEISDMMFSGDVTLKFPEFLGPKQTLALSSALAEDKPDVYISRYFRNSVAFERSLSSRLVASVGAALKISRVNQLDEEKEFGLISLPLGFIWNGADDPLNPVRGVLAQGFLVPYFDVLETHQDFHKAYGSGTAYLSAPWMDPFQFSIRLAGGSILDAPFDQIPADERFYAGGGGSIRGFKYMSVTPLKGDDPIGGLSLLETSAELQFNVTKSLGIVSFIDGGTAYSSSLPDFDTPTMWGAGGGLRYATPVGPLRFDVAFPITRRSIDAPYQFYIGIGAAF